MNAANNKKILIVEDNKDFLWILRESFKNQGMVVVYAQDGEEGLAQAQKENPDLIIIDVGLPKMDGIAMSKKIKEKGVAAQMIFLTNLKDAHHVGDAIDSAETADYIIKSDVRMDDIVARAKEKLGLK